MSFDKHEWTSFDVPEDLHDHLSEQKRNSAIAELFDEFTEEMTNVSEILKVEKASVP